MAASHNGKVTGFHHQDDVISMDQSGFFGQSDLSSLASYNNFWDTTGYHSHNGSNLASDPVQDGTYMQRGFYGSETNQLPAGFMPVAIQPEHMAFGFNDQTASQNAGQFGYLPSQYEHQHYTHQPLQHTPMETQEQDDDNESVGSATTDCDSNCGLADPCTDESCADREDACTDRHCPEKDCPDTNCPEKMPSEVVVAAATLAAFGVEPPQQQSQVTAQQGIGGQELSSAQQPFYHEMPDLTAITPWDVVKHISTAHTDLASSGCTGPCLITNPQIFQHFQSCPFPDSFDFQLGSFSDLYNPFSLNSFDNDGTANFSSQNHVQFHGCGAEISNPQALVEHFNTQHRPFLENVLAQGNFYNAAAAPQLPTRILSSSSPYGLEPSLSPATHSPHVSFPPTPLSLSQDISNPQKPSGHQSRSSTVSQGATGTECEQQQCLWCDPETGERCGQIFADSEALFGHVNAEHIQKLEKGAHGFMCCWESCKRRGHAKEGFPQRSKIERHMHTHIGRKPYACEQCGQRFSAQQALTQHMLIHSDEKPLRCDWEGCGKTFRQQSALTMHRRIHTGDKPLKCPICGKAFSESSNLSKHKRIHETKGRFSCSEPGCDKTFHRLDQLRRHQKSHAATATGGDAKGVEGITTDSDGVMEVLHGRAEDDGQPMRKRRSR